MYLRVTRARFDPAQIDEVRAIGADLVAAMRRQPGFRGYYAGADRDRGTIVAMSIWETAEHAVASHGAFGDVVDRLRAVGVELEAPETLEGIAHT